MTETIGQRKDGTERGKRSPWRRLALIGFVVLTLGACRDSSLRQDLWWTADQRGERFYLAGEYAEAAAAYEDPYRKGIALYRAEQFDAALDQFARLDTAESFFARGNALAHLERYEEAIEAYGRALEIRPDYADAEENIAYLQPFLPIDFEGGVSGVTGKDAEADDVVFDADADRLGEEGVETLTEEGGMLSESQIADMWLEQVDASPAAFLRAKFRYQAETKVNTGASDLQREDGIP